MSVASIPDEPMFEGLQRENAELLQFLYACPVGLVALDGNGTISMLNPLAMQLVLPLATNQDIINLFKILEPYAPDLRALISGFAPRQGTICEGHRAFIGRDRGKSADKVIAITLVKLGADRFMATMSDVSVQVAQERRLKQAETWFSSLIDGANDFAALSLDANGLIDHVNGSVHRQTGFAEHELIGRGLDLLEAPDLASGAMSCREQVALAARDGWYLDEGWCARRDGSRLWCQRLISVCREEGNLEGRAISGFTVVLRAVTRQAANASALKRRLTADHLTGAANRAHFFEIAEHEASRCRRDGGSTALVVLDIDHFKRVNDRYGHGLGDEVLKSVSAACMAALRPGDTLARLGGEEFVALMPAMDLPQACEAAERLRRAVAGVAVATSQMTIGVTASFGCAVINASSVGVAEVLAQADDALYAAKHAGRDRVASASDHAVAA